MWRSPARRGTLRRTVRKDAGVRALGALEFTCSPAADVFRPTPPYRSINHVRQEEVFMAERKHNVAREGIVAGVIGATSVAIWFFVVDAVAGHPLATPGTLGRALVSVLGMPEASSGMRLLDQPATAVVLYTLFHYAAFIAVGILVTALVHKAETQPHVLAGFLILFVAFELGFYGLTALLSEVGLGGMAWYQIGAANLIASLLMGTYLWRRHPALGRELRFVLNGQE